jgi:Fanconi anemia group M protein
MVGMSLTAQAIKISHAIELLETQTLSGLDIYMNSMIEQAKQKKSKAVQTIVKSPEFSTARILLQQLLAKKVEHPKISKILEITEGQFKENPNSKIIIFSQFRETAQSISQKINEISGIKSSIFIGQAKKLGAGLSQKEQRQIIEDFREGKLNVICATSIGEEGLDIPEVSAVIFYEPIPSAIRKIQRAGRTARLMPGKLIILVTKDTRDEIHHYASSARERKMYKVIENVKNEMKNHPRTLSDF